MIELVKELLISTGTVLIGITLNILALFGLGNSYHEQIVDQTQPSNQQKEKIVEEKSREKAVIKEAVINSSEEQVEIQEVVKTEIVETIQTIVQPIINQTQTINTDELNTSARNALVNVLCSTKSSGSLNPSSGSGVIIDPRGIVLTNAHIAQYILLEQHGTGDYISCILRTGAPAYPTYLAEILYISPTWIKGNAEKIIENDPVGTGENDFALLHITKHIQDDVNLPDQFPFIEIETDENNIKKNVPVLIAGYPAGFLGGTIIQKSLWPVTAFSYITEVFTFISGTIDLVSLNGNIAAQKGSSGGPVLNANTSKLVGISVTRTDAEQTADRVLNAITIPHINRSIFSEIGINLGSYISGDLSERADNFNKTISPSLAELLEEVLRK